MNTSKFLARVIGIYQIIISIVILVDLPRFSEIILSLINNTPVMFVTGCFTLLIGTLMVVSHNVWQWHWRLIITIVAWLTFLKGISILLFPQFINEITRLFVQNMFFAYTTAVIDFIFGALLIYFGFKR